MIMMTCRLWLERVESLQREEEESVKEVTNVEALMI